MCNKAVDDSLAALKLIPDWFVTSKMIKELLLLCTQMEIYSPLIKNLPISYFLVMKWVFLIHILIILILIKILMKMILILLFISDFYINLEKCKALKKEWSEELMPVVWYPKR